MDGLSPAIELTNVASLEPAVYPSPERTQMFRDVIESDLDRWTQSYIYQRLLEFSSVNDGRILLKALKIPYIPMPLPEGNFPKMIEEARAVRHRFVSHRMADSGGWMSLCLHGIDASKTLAFESYGYTTEADLPYCWTDVADTCPVTSTWLKELLSQKFFNKLFRVRYMWLKPGGYIAFHRDRPNGMTSLGPLNVALNMPKNCHWLFEEYGHLPFTEGSAFGVDVSNKHGVWNDSQEDRIHIIVHGTYGPAYYDAIGKGKEQLLESLRQNVPEAVTKPKSKTPTVKIAIWDYLEGQPLTESYARKLKALTLHFLRLRSMRVIKFPDDHSLHRILSESAESGDDWCAVVVPGTVITDKFFHNVNVACKEAKPNVGLICHIMDRKDRGFGLHPQFMLVRLSAWIAAGRPRFEFKSLDAQTLISPQRSVENIHDDYTPLWLKPTYEETKRKPGVFGWNVFDLFFRQGFEIQNLPDYLRAEKKFLYPDQNSAAVEDFLDNIANFENNPSTQALSAYQRSVAEYLYAEGSGFGKKLFLFNTEGVGDVNKRKTRKPLDACLSVAAGFKDLHVLRFNGFNENTELHYFDISPQSLFLKKYIYENWEGDNYPEFLRRIYKTPPAELAGSVFTSNQPEFEKKWQMEIAQWESSDVFVQTYLAARKLPKFYHQVDLLTQPRFPAQVISELTGRNFAIWYSNCFNYTPALAQMSWDLAKVETVGFEFILSLHLMALKQGKEILLYGEDTRFGSKCEFLGQSAREVFS